MLKNPLSAKNVSSFLFYLIIILFIFSPVSFIRADSVIATQEWMAQYTAGSNTENIALRITRDSSDNIYVLGYSRDLSTNNYDFVTIKYGSP